MIQSTNNLLVNILIFICVSVMTGNLITMEIVSFVITHVLHALVLINILVYLANLKIIEF